MYGIVPVGGPVPEAIRKLGWTSNQLSGETRGRKLASTHQIRNSACLAVELVQI